jgi:hypothetical protein
MKLDIQLAGAPMAMPYARSLRGQTSDIRIQAQNEGVLVGWKVGMDREEREGKRRRKGLTIAEVYDEEPANEIGSVRG